jgi:hypothetical protein
MIINRDNATEVEVHRFVAEAQRSWRRANWPSHLKTTLGNRMPFIFSSRQ